MAPILLRRGLMAASYTPRRFEQNPHSKKEWVCLEEMEECRNVLIELAEVWGNSPA